MTKRPKTFYVSGPMTGYENLNCDAFAQASTWLRKLGHVAINPAEAFGGGELDHVAYETFMRFHVHSILTVDALVVLAGWERSRGARFEVHMAVILGLPVYMFDADKHVIRELRDPLAALTTGVTT